jgi:hypothetical protein
MLLTACLKLKVGLVCGGPGGGEGEGEGMKREKIYIR